MKKERTCDLCRETYPAFKVKRICKQWRCVYCNKEKRLKKRDYLLHTEGGVRRKSDMMKEATEKREKKKAWEKVFRSKVTKTRRRTNLKVPKFKGEPMLSNVLGMFFKKDERQVLYWKYRKEGMDSGEANKQLQGCIKFMGELVTKLRKQRRSEKDINRIFKEKLAKFHERK